MDTTMVIATITLATFITMVTLTHTTITTRDHSTLNKNLNLVTAITATPATTTDIIMAIPTTILPTQAIVTATSDKDEVRYGVRTGLVAMSDMSDTFQPLVGGFTNLRNCLLNYGIRRTLRT